MSMKWEIYDLYDKTESHKHAVQLVEHDIGLNTLDLAEDIKNWFKENNIYNIKHEHRLIWYLENKEDITWLLLRWGSTY